MEPSRKRRKLKRSRLLKGGVQRVISQAPEPMNGKSVVIQCGSRRTIVRKVNVLGPCTVRGIGEDLLIYTDSPLQAFGWPRKRKSRKTPA